MARLVPKCAVQKRRACDECRTRKLACSKDPEGCERCKRENIACHYSEQKQMGRPRKRQMVESTDSTGSLPVDPFSAEPLAFVSNTSSLDPSYETQSSAPQFADDFIGPMAFELGKPVWNFGSEDIFGGPPINFSEPEITHQESSTLLEQSIPPLSYPFTDSNQPLVISSESHPQIVASPCSCLASIYLSLASLQDFPPDIASALKSVRTAAATASAAIRCQSCGSVVLNDPNPPIESFQNTMLLGTILPIIANGYHKLLKQIDEETEAADAAGVTKTFKIWEYGGVCGLEPLVKFKLPCENLSTHLNGLEMAAHQWRTTIRALLKLDIYGGDQGDFKHKGLKDLVTELESRQRSRHELLDAYLEAGGSSGHGMFGQADCRQQEAASGSKPHGCLQILNIAKVAIDSLVIP